MGRELVLVLMLMASSRLVWSLEETCLVADEEPHLLFGTRTAYTFVHNPKYSRSNLHHVPGCRATAIWMVVRYGSQVPSAEEIANFQQLEVVKRNIVENYGKGNYRDTGFRMCPADLDLLDRWFWNPRHNESRAEYLTAEGYSGVKQLARTWRDKFPELFTNNKYDYMFKLGREYVASTSFRAFAEGLFGQQAESVDLPREIDDTLMTPYKDCPAWANLVDYNASNSELRAFESKTEYRTMLSNVSRRMGYSYDVDPALIRTAYRMCAYNKAWDVVSTSAWCTIFSKEELELLEYGEDLDTYYKYGYGNSLYESITCPIVKDLMDFVNVQMEDNGPQQPRTRVFLSDAGGVLLAHAALGLGRDQALLSPHNYHAAMLQNRKWRSSLLSPYTGNVAVVLYKCPERSVQSGAGSPLALVLSNWRPAEVSGCRVGLCPLSALLPLLPPDCVPPTHYCGAGHTHTTGATGSLLLATLVTLVANFIKLS